MKVLIIYDSFYGNTEQIAQAMGKALGSTSEIEVLRVSTVQLQQLTGAQLLIVGSPTRAFKATPAVMKLLGSIPANGLKGVKVAAFDTRISVKDTGSAILRVLVSLFGYAAKPISASLFVKKGGELALPPEGFTVKASEGPLKEGELDRAAAWAGQLVAGQ